MSLRFSRWSDGRECLRGDVAPEGLRVLDLSPQLGYGDIVSAATLAAGALALAKIAGNVLCQAYRRAYGADFIAGDPADAFGPGDDFSPEREGLVRAE